MINLLHRPLTEVSAILDFGDHLENRRILRGQELFQCVSCKEHFMLVSSTEVFSHLAAPLGSSAVSALASGASGPEFDPSLFSFFFCKKNFSSQNQLRFTLRKPSKYAYFDTITSSINA